MSTVIEELVAKLGINVDEQSFVKAAALSQLVAGGMTKIAGAAWDAAKAIVGIVGDTVEYADSLDKLATTTGIGVENLQRLADAAHLADIPLEALGNGLGLLGRNIAQARGGSAELQKAFGALGIGAGELNSLGVEDMFLRIADGLDGMSAEGRIDAIMAVMGRSGRQFLPLLAEGADSLREAMAESLPLTAEQIAAGAELDLTLKQIAQTAAFTKRQIGGALIASAAKLGKAFLEAMRAFSKFVAPKIQKALDGVIKGFTWLLKNLWAVKGALIAIAGTMLAVYVPAISAAVAAAWAWASALTAVKVASYAAGAASAAAGVLATAGWAAFFILIGLLAEDFWVFIRGGDSSIGAFLEGNGAKFDKWLRGILAVKPGDDWLLVALKQGLRELLDIQSAWERRLRQIRDLWQGIRDLALETVRTLGLTAQAFVADPVRTLAYLNPRGPGGAFGGGAGPSASVSSSPSSPAGGGSYVINAPVTQTINAAPGQSAEEVGQAASDQSVTWWQGVLQESRAAVGP